MARAVPPVDRDRFLRAADWLPNATLAAAETAAQRDDEVVLARIDNDGRLLPHHGPVPDFEMIAGSQFVERYRYDLDLVFLDGRILVRKDYRGDVEAFVREWAGLARLGGMGAPAVHHADESGLRLYKSLLPGPTVRQILVEAGARILSVDTADDPRLRNLTPEARIEAVWNRGRQAFRAAGLVPLPARLAGQLAAVHRRGVTGFSLTFGNVVLEGDGREPYFLDFDGALVHRSPSGPLFRFCAGRDRRLLARIYGAAAE